MTTRRASITPAIARKAATLHARGVVAARTGDQPLAAALIRQAIRLDPGPAQYHSHLGNVLQQQGRLDEAIACQRRAIHRQPDFAQAHYNLGNALARQGQVGEAAVCYRHALAIQPDYTSARCNLAASLQQQGRWEETVAELRDAATRSPDDPAVLCALGAALRASGKLDEAAAAHQRAIDRAPGFADAHNNLGNVLRDQGLAESAIACYRHAIALNPDFTSAHHNLGVALLDEGRQAEAYEAFRRAIELQPDFADGHNGVGLVHRQQGELADAIVCFRRAIELQPNFASAHHNLGVALLEDGALDEAYAELDLAVRRAPKRGAFHRMLANTGRIVPGSVPWQRLEALATELDSLPETDRLELHFALATLYADSGETENSIAHLLQGNRLKRSRITYDEVTSLALFERIKTVFTPSLLNSRDGSRSADRRAIFVVGMPRSGTTLVEQILASHPNVHGAGELPNLPPLLKSAPGQIPFPERAASLTPAEWETLASAYLAGLTARAPASALAIVDKLPQNFLHIGLIHMALPGARIIHVQRDPIDTCLSCFSKLFTDNQPFTYDLVELGRYYNAYRDLMDHWRQALPPGAMLEVRYEDIVGDFEAQAARLLAHCDMPWNEAVLAFHRTRNVVRTASAAQVRRPLYATSVGRWHAFSGLAAALGLCPTHREKVIPLVPS